MKRLMAISTILSLNEIETQNTKLQAIVTMLQAKQSKCTISTYLE